MFLLGLLIASLSYLLFFLGIAGFFFENIIFITSLIWLVVVLIVFLVRRKKVHGKIPFKHVLRNSFFYLLTAQIIVNLIGVLGPEISFDALWYHLTLPKIFLQEHKIFYIPGGLLYYSTMPKFTEMLYAAALSIQGEVLAKFIHFIFGIMIISSLYFYSFKRFGKRVAFIAPVIFYSNLVVGWQSTTAYIDLSRTFYELLSFIAFINFTKNKRRVWLIISALMLGLAISTKLIAAGSIIVFLVLIIFVGKKESIGSRFKKIALFLTICILPILPWLFFSYVQTGNPLYPIFSNYPIVYSNVIINPINFIIELLTLFIKSPDPISPLYAIFLPVGIFCYKRLSRDAKIAMIYFFVALIVWYFTPRTGGGRFILPYLPVASIILVEIFLLFKNKYMLSVFIILVFLFATISITYRAFANTKYLPVILGYESKQVFLKNHLNFSFGDFYDIDGYFSRTITKNDTVLIYGIHNLYYVDFPFVHESFIKKNTKVNYVLLRDMVLPDHFSNSKLYYENKLLNVKLYGRTDGGKWQY